VDSIEKVADSQGIIVAIDADNCILSAAREVLKFKNYDSALAGFERMFDWMKGFGNIIRTDVYLSPSRCENTNLNSLWHNLWAKYRGEFLIKYIYCPNRKTRQRGQKMDNVDAHLMEHTREITRLYAGRFHYLCLASGDGDYYPMLCQLKKEMDIEIAFAIGGEGSFAKIYRKMEMIGKHPTTGEELVHQFSTQHT